MKTALAFLAVFVLVLGALMLAAAPAHHAAGLPSSGVRSLENPDLPTTGVQAMPLAPTDLHITNSTATAVSLAWTNAPGFQHGVILYYGTNASTVTTTVTLVPEVNTYTVSGIFASTHEYYFGVADDNVTGYGPMSAEVALYNSVPAMVTGLHVTANASTTVSLAWTNPTGIVSNVRVIYGTTPGMSDGIFDAGAGATSFTATGLTASTVYYFSVAAGNPLGYGPAPAEVAQETGATTPALIAGPSHFALASENLTTALFNFTWTAAPGPAPTHYTVFSGSPGETLSSVGTSTTTHFNMTGAYSPYFVVAAYNSTGTKYSLGSSEVAVGPLAFPTAPSVTIYSFNATTGLYNVSFAFDHNAIDVAHSWVGFAYGVKSGVAGSYSTWGLGTYSKTQQLSGLGILPALTFIGESPVFEPNELPMPAVVTEYYFAPNPVTHVVLSGITGGHIVVSWKNPANDLDTYVYWSTAVGGFTHGKWYASWSLTNQSVTLTAAATSLIGVVSYNAVDFGDAVFASNTTGWAGTSSLAAPTGLGLTSLDGEQATVSWTNPANATYDRLVVYNNGSSLGSVYRSFIFPAQDSYTFLLGTTPNIYTVVVAAETGNGTGDSMPSNAIDVTYGDGNFTGPGDIGGGPNEPAPGAPAGTISFGALLFLGVAAAFGATIMAATHKRKWD